MNGYEMMVFMGEGYGLAVEQANKKASQQRQKEVKEAQRQKESSQIEQQIVDAKLID
jgi:hypothetical protein